MRPIEFIEQGKGVVTLCGSTKYFEQCMEVNRQLTFNGWIVLMCGSWGHSYHAHLPKVPVNHEVKKLHFHKILKSHLAVVVSDDSGYYGESTKDEIQFCKYIGVPVVYWTPQNQYFGKSIEKDIPNSYEIPSRIMVDNIVEVWWKVKELR